MSAYELRYKGARWRIVYGSYEGVNAFALDELQRVVQTFFPYVVQVQPAGSAPAQGHEDHLVLVGTAKDNRLIAELEDKRLLTVPKKRESYATACLKSPWNADRRLLVIAGRDTSGTLYGAESLCAGSLSRHWPSPNTPLVVPDIPARARDTFDAMPEFANHESPAIEARGIWTWGYVIYDYKRFFDNMARLRMNMLIVWNDCPPLNAPAIVSYAHDRGIRVIMGFHWGWGRNDLDIANPDHARMMRGEIAEQYRRDYLPLGIDGIYFQTLTEHDNTRVGARSLAAVAADWVNAIAAGLYEINPDLYIQFGLHATSIRENYPDLSLLDPRISIVWEDAGALPYGYNPNETSYDAASGRAGPWSGTEPTIEYSKKLASFRPGTEFAMVPKGWTCLRWREEFEHHGPFILGERQPAWIRRRLEERQPRWDFVNTQWIKHYPLAMRFYREILACKPARMLVAGLVEDGMFEAAIQPGVALFAHTIWNPAKSAEDILDLATSPYYRNA